MSKVFTIAYIVWLKLLRKKDVYVLLILLGCLLAALVSLDIFGLGGVVGYVKDIGLLIAWIFAWILAVNISSREIPEEEDRGTIFPLLAKPVTRLQVILGKWLGAWTVVVASSLLFYVLLVLVVLIKGGRFNLLVLLQAFTLHGFMLAIVTAITVAVSCRMNQDAAAAISYVLTAAAYLIVPRVPAFMAASRGMRSDALMLLYNILPHFEVFDMRKRIIHDFDPLSWGTYFLVVSYGAVIVLVFLAFGWFFYRSKTFSRGNLH